MRQGGSEACARRRLRKRTIPSNPLGFEEKSLTAPERGVKSGLPTARRKSRRQPGAFDAKVFRDGGKKSASRAAQRSAAAWQSFFGKCSGMLRALSSQDRSGLNAARLRIGVSGIVSLLKGEAAGTAWECRESAACCGRGGFLSLSRGASDSRCRQGLRGVARGRKRSIAALR